MEKVNLSSDKLKNAWEYAKFSFEKDGTCGFSWPQRNYRCSFCKREFKSAQALGGHMNVHRRERAKMRLLPLGDYLNPNPNFFPSSSSSSSAAKFLPYKSYQSSHQNGFLATADQEKDVPTLVVRSHFDPVTPGRLRDHTGKSLNKRALSEVRDLQLLKKGNNDSILWKKKEIVRVGLNMSNFLFDAKDDLDLELRLGHSN